MTATAATPSSTGAPSYTESLPRVPASAGRARRLVGDALATWYLAALQPDAELVVSELVTNAVEHARADVIRVTITRLAAGAVRIGVIDKDCGEPSPRAAGPRDEDGRGLVIVGALAVRWGVDRMRWGKRVWADLGVDGAAGGGV
ncbi:ATP-binding protein [Streptomyces sp. DSM 42041]|uniref:ATP-binding protein n=1 Tax=Streptomyces hazeniae TaxID=3075538 RepID=A0ABU2NJN4_9ACTN|nr:ATP-binding protein [Streptomyces sp. DSM 42041]MDT0377204.1 ATP-binding protein [Streptomyces sp. DSM 42041]